MRKTIQEKIELMKNVLEEDPFNLVIGEIQERIITDSDFNLKEVALQDYYNFFREYGSIRCGSIIIFGQNELDDFQFPVADMPGEFEEWICIGKIDPYPLYINKKNGMVCCLFEDSKIKSYEGWNDFLDNYVFGERYIEIVGKDEWYELLREQQII
ncbi:hypothetical protein BBD42_14365 [Paenibacillus sp. BIHB 4019]|uniref:Knr4/Smi1-like domain-containing protein n=1 Tax=Paenibacillus sp. BIHB 4019 TaxID=1870819 RepID=A0A1B2DIK1_9BACL|nr:hypothetical protein [Paenibacillus sp. BIHB 4019]ANY67526.1 hypothetical protein BBD42_14365 [Paenibacillus sp. BIHB 4019]